MVRTTIVIPCYNEVRRLDVEAFKSYAPSERGVRFVFVNDGSTDETIRVLQSLQETDPEVFDVLALERNMGKAEAVRNGLLKAFESAPDYVGFWDADLATPLEAITELRDLLEERPDLEMVFGSRVNLLGRSVHRNPMRHYIGRVFATAAVGVLGVPIYDTQCGAKLFRVTDETVELFQEPFISKWIFDVEIIARVRRARKGSDLPPVNRIIYEHPLMVWHDRKGSKLRYRDFIIVAIDLMRIYFKYMRR